MEEVTDANEPKQSENAQIAGKDKRSCLQISHDEESYKDFFYILNLYIETKKRIRVKPVDFKCLFFYKKDKVFETDINNAEDFRELFMNLKSKILEGETVSFDFNVVFSSLAKMVQLPHPVVCSKSLPPPHVYHCVMLFGHNCNIPVMKQTNAFYFLIKSPFFTFDMVYIYNNFIEANICDMIGHALYSLYDVLNGYFFPVSYINTDKQFKVFAQLLGHPLIRQPQERARFNWRELTTQENVK